MRHMDHSALNVGLPSSTAEYLLDRTCEDTAVLDRIIAELGDLSLMSYLKMLQPQSSSPSWQKREDLMEAMVKYTAPLLGKDVAERCTEEINRCPMALTANHHGVDYFSQSVQGTLLFALSKSFGNSWPPAVPVFSCGNIPMNNLTYPLGMLFYGLSESRVEASPQRVPIFPDRHKRTMVSSVTAFDRAMIERALKRIDSQGTKGEIPPALAACAKEILLSEYGIPEILKLSTYSDQSVILNHRLWKRLFAEPDSAPDVVVLELEKLVTILLQSDLLDPQSLAWRVLFNRKLRKQVLAQLDGQRTCWSKRNLDLRLRSARGQNPGQVSSSGCGTLFFWGVDSAGRKVPLTLERDTDGGERLRGVDDRGEIWDLPFTPSALVEDLIQNRLIPSLFTSYLTVALARGVVCLGGYYQAEYLPAIQEGIVKSLYTIPEYRSMVEPVKGVVTDGYLSGMQAVMTRIGDHLVPAGPLEIIAGGGLKVADLQKVGSLTLREAHLASLSETVSDISDHLEDLKEWKTQLALDCSTMLNDRIVIK
jgi:hypothetical protein